MNPAFLAESGVLPDALVRSGIRRRLMGILKDMEAKEGSLAESKARFAADLRQGPATIEQDRANRQHYELPPEFFESFLGYRRKYSCCYWHDGVGDLDAAEDAMLEMTASRAGIEPGQTILDLGCGWGSFSLWAAEKFPGIKIHALSNSSAQIDYILREASQRGFSNITAERADITCYSTEELYDRVVSVESGDGRTHQGLGRSPGQDIRMADTGREMLPPLFLSPEHTLSLQESRPLRLDGVLFFCRGNDAKL